MRVLESAYIAACVEQRRRCWVAHGAALWLSSDDRCTRCGALTFTAFSFRHLAKPRPGEALKQDFVVIHCKGMQEDHFSLAHHIY